MLKKENSFQKRQTEDNTSIIKRNPNAVSRVHKESINEIKEIIVSRKAKRYK